MTIKECIDLVDSLKPNQYTIKEKVMWLSFIEQVIINEVLKTHEGYDGRYDSFEGYSEDKLTVAMIVPSPYDRLYTQYLKMKIDEENGEVTRYNNSASLYNAYMSEYRRHYNKTHIPIDTSKRKPAKHTTTTSASVTDAQLEGLKNELAYILTNYFADSVSAEKIYNAVMNYMSNNARLFKGKDGEPGKQGEPGKDGYTPIKGIDYTDGKNGTNGRDGKDGEDGRTPIKGIDYFDGRDGKDGKDGEKGEPGYTPIKGIDYTDGRDGYTPVKDVDYFDGKDGKDGDKGEDGVSPIVNIVDTEEGQQIEITDKEGKKTFKVKNGGVQSDYEQNDETKLDYIKNRPFHIEYEESTANYLEVWTLGDTDSKIKDLWGLVPGNKYSVEIELLNNRTVEKSLTVDVVARYADSKAEKVLIAYDDTAEDIAFGISDDLIGGKTTIEYPQSLYSDYNRATIKFSGTLRKPTIHKIPRKYIENLTKYNFDPDFLDTLADKNDINEVYGRIHEIVEEYVDESNDIFAQATPMNLLDMESAELGKYMTNTGLVYEGSSFLLTDYIPVEVGTVLTIQGKTSSVNRPSIFIDLRFVTAYDADKNILTSLGAQQVKSYVVPEGVSFVKISIGNYNLRLDLAIVPSEFIVPYEEYSTEKIKAKYYDKTYLNCMTKDNLALPEKMYSFVGYPSVIYFDNIMPYNINDVYVYKYGGNGKGTLYADRWEYTSDTAETVVGSVDIYAHNWQRIREQNVEVIVKDTTEKESLKVLVIGDSTVNAGRETQKMLDLASADGYDLTLLGTRGTTPNNYEGVGGWTAKIYVTYASNNPFYNPTSKTFDFAYYMTQQGYDGVDCVFLQLGINDIFSPRDNSARATAIREYLAYMKTIVNSIHSYDANIKVVLNLVLPCDADQNKFGEQYGLHPRWMYNRNAYEANINLIANFRGATNVYINPHNAVIDTKTNFNGDVHPNDNGYAQLGTQMYSFMRAIN